jgi:hypothetical protein
MRYIMKMPRRPKNGVVTRKTADDLAVTTIFKNKEVVKILCVTCKQLRLKSEFYLESKSKRKYDNQVRKQCVVCWDKHNGYMGPERNVPGNTIVMFCEEVN